MAIAAFKLEHFARDNPGRQFPAYRSLTTAECAEVQRRLADPLRLVDPEDLLALVKTLLRESRALPNVDAEKESFDLNAALAAAGAADVDSVLINWYRFDDIDEMRRDDAVRHLSDFWYPAADAIDFFDASCRWVVMIGYDGDVRVWTAS